MIDFGFTVDFQLERWKCGTPSSPLLVSDPWASAESVIGLFVSAVGIVHGSAINYGLQSIQR